MAGTTAQPPNTDVALFPRRVAFRRDTDSTNSIPDGSLVDFSGNLVGNDERDYVRSGFLAPLLARLLWQTVRLLSTIRLAILQRVQGIQASLCGIER
ncbi:MAG: hypothetical protein HC890_05605 [Chloroflexaceae bacterium]|nr:hypothetical protein [Chloroflexaceae bacterium]